jgi:ElaB/YqjD/DUF883 family membrane-anchored ribosome-binding protein
MAKKTAKSADQIQDLLDERQKIINWLERLGDAAGDIPDDVRDRVRTDYEKRLDTVAEELKGFTQDLQETLATHQATYGELRAKESDAETRLAEAKLRHAVGEFPEAKWNELQSEITSELERTRDSLKSTDAEVGRMEEVLKMIQGRTVASVPEPAPVPKRAPPPPPPPAPEPVAAAEAKGTSSVEGFDELAFLKSVTEDEKQGPEVSKAAGREPYTEPLRPMRVSQEVPAIPEVSADGSPGPQKTLKCGECGVMNFPTEWYCERCGAELASL